MRTQTALALMKQALAIYDQDGHGMSSTACHLQAAIDAATGATRPMRHAEIDAVLLHWFEETIAPSDDSDSRVKH